MHRGCRRESWCSSSTQQSKCNRVRRVAGLEHSSMGLQPGQLSWCAAAAGASRESEWPCPCRDVVPWDRDVNALN